MSCGEQGISASVKVGDTVAHWLVPVGGGAVRKHLGAGSQIPLVEIVGRVDTNGWACCYLYPTVASGEKLASLQPPGKAGFPLLVPPAPQLATPAPKPSHTARPLTAAICPEDLRTLLSVVCRILHA